MVHVRERGQVANTVTRATDGSPVDRFIAATLKGALLVFGIATCLPVLLAINVDLGNRVLFGGGLEYTAMSEPALRHWGIMVFGIGALMIAAAFCPWLRFATMVFCGVEKAFLVFLVLGVQSEPWGPLYVNLALLDGIITLYTVIYFVSSHGRPHRWVRADSMHT